MARTTSFAYAEIKWEQSASNCGSNPGDVRLPDLPQEARPYPGDRGDAPTSPLTPGAAAPPVVCLRHCPPHS